MELQKLEGMKAGQTVPRLLVSPREAAKALAVSEKTLWSRTSPRGEIPVVRIGRAVRYDVEHLKAWIKKKCESAQNGALHSVAHKVVWRYEEEKENGKTADAEGPA